MNKVIIMGRLGAAPELRAAGKASVAKLSVATTEKWTDDAGRPQERTDWHRVDVWGKRGESLAKLLVKGEMVLVEGRLQTQSYEKNGEKRYATSIVAERVELTGRGKPNGAHAPGNGAVSQACTPAPPPAGASDDDIPF